MTFRFDVLEEKKTPATDVRPRGISEDNYDKL